MQKHKLSESNIIAIFGFIAIFSLIILFSDSQNTVSVVKDRAVKDAFLPYLDGRTLDGVKTTPEGIPVFDEERAYLEGVPFRSYSRVPDMIPTLFTSCGELLLESSLRIKKDIEMSVHKNSTCPYVPELMEYCCPLPYLPGAFHVVPS